MAGPQIVGIGGWDDALADYVLGLADADRPRLLWVGTAAMESAERTLELQERLAGRVEFAHLRFHPWPPADLLELALAQDVILVGGGNTANLLAIWRAHGFDDVLREAWQEGVVLAGWSAGMICWFECGVTDSFGPALAALDGLGFLPGSACPHYDGEELRRPVYRRLVAEGLAPGYAADDGVALRFAGRELAEVVTARRGAAAYRVDAGSETTLEARVLP